MLVIGSCGCSPAQPPTPPTTTSAGVDLAQQCALDLRTLKTAVEAYRVTEGLYPVSQDEVVGVFIDQPMATADFTSTRQGPPAYTQITVCR